MKPVVFLVAAGALLALTPPASAHKSPAEVIDALSRQMDATGPTARALTTRAYEHLSLGQVDAAIADFRAAIALESRDGMAIAGCLEALLLRGDLAEAEALAKHGLSLGEDVALQAPYHAFLARVGMRRGDWPGARAAWQLALRSPQPEIDWFLGEAECLTRLGRHDEQVKALTRAMQRNPSVVLHRAWIRALVDAGDLIAASREIEAGLAHAHWKSAWLLLRARVRGLRQDDAGRKADAAEALAEIQSRLNPERPDPHLAFEEAEARRLLAPRSEAGHQSPAG